MTVQEKMLFHCQSSYFSFLLFKCMQPKVNGAYYNLIFALLSCLSGIESIMKKALEGSGTASCAERSGCLFLPFTVSSGKQRDLLGRQWEGNMEEKRLEAMAVGRNMRLLYHKYCKGRSFIFPFSLCPSLSLIFPSHQLLSL